VVFGCWRRQHVIDSRPYAMLRSLVGASTSGLSELIKTPRGYIQRASCAAETLFVINNRWWSQTDHSITLINSAIPAFLYDNGTDPLMMKSDDNAAEKCVNPRVMMIWIYSISPTWSPAMGGCIPVRYWSRIVVVTLTRQPRSLSERIFTRIRQGAARAALSAAFVLCDVKKDITAIHN